MRIVKSVRFCFQWLPLRPDTCHDFRNTHRHKVLGTIQRPSPRPIQSARPGVLPSTAASTVPRLSISKIAYPRANCNNERLYNSME